MRIWTVGGIVLLCVAILCGCGAEMPSTQALLDAYMREAEALPAGEVYHARTGGNDNTPPDDALVSAMYGEEAKRCFPLVEEYAIYLSSSTPCEIAVFRCYAASDTDALARMCLSRSETLRTLLRHTEYHALVENANIEVRGRTVIMRVLPPK